MNKIDREEREPTHNGNVPGLPGFGANGYSPAKHCQKKINKDYRTKHQGPQNSDPDSNKLKKFFRDLFSLMDSAPTLPVGDRAIVSHGSM